MDFELDINQKFKKNWFIWISGFLTIYFSFNIFCGDRNIYRYFELKHKIAQETEISRHYENQKANLQRNIDYLSNVSLDIDLLEERARAVLNMVAEDEFIILDNEI